MDSLCAMAPSSQNMAPDTQLRVENSQGLALSSHCHEVVVVGGGLTGLVTAFMLRQKEVDVAVVERENRIGGQIHTYHEGDFTFESGPSTSALSHPEVAELFELLDKSTLLKACKEAHARWIWHKRKFVEMPHGLWSGLTTPLVTLYDKFRLLAEPFRKRGVNPDETVGEISRRRLGNSYFRNFVDPFVSGVYAGDPDKLVTRFALPKLYALEQTYGSFIRGAIQKMRTPKTERDRLATKEVWSCEGGMERLIEQLADGIGRERIYLGVTSAVLRPEGKDGWELHGTVTTTEDAMSDVSELSSACGEQLSEKKEMLTAKNNFVCRAQRVITTCPAYALPQLLPFVESSLLKDVSTLTYAPVVQVAVGFKDVQGRSFQAFGGLVPSTAGRKVMGILFPSSCFSHRAPEGGALFSVFMGGVRHPEWVEASDEAITETVLSELQTMLGLPRDLQPDLVRIFRHPRAIPQYEASSVERFAAIAAIQSQYPTLTLAGNLRDGIGMSDRIKQACGL